MENVFLPTVDDADDGPAIADGGAAVFLLDHMSSDRTRMVGGDDYDVFEWILWL